MLHVVAIARTPHQKKLGRTCMISQFHLACSTPPCGESRGFARCSACTDRRGFNMDGTLSNPTPSVIAKRQGHAWSRRAYSESCPPNSKYLTCVASSGSKDATGASLCRVSHTLTHPSRPHVTSSGAPYPRVYTIPPCSNAAVSGGTSMAPLAVSSHTCPPQPSILLTIEACACTSKIGLFVHSRSHNWSCPSKFPVARRLSP